MDEHQQEEKPKWMLELENRKRKPRLAHEAGAGAPCLTCESACPGLDLHFWRKICKNCKCRGDNHDVDDDEFPQFELLFGPNSRNKKNRSVLLKMNDVKQAHTESQFEWIPPNVTKELATDYMNALPSDKLPIKGSVGAALRRQQLQKQLPLHDIDHKACDGLSEQERKEFEKYLDNLKSCAGQGKVTKLTTIRPFDKSLMTPANATDVQQLSPQHSHQLSNLGGGLNLRTPSSFIPKGMQQKFDSLNHTISQNPAASVLPDIDIVKVPHSKATNDVNTKFGQYHHALANVSNSGSLAQRGNVPGVYHAGGNHKNPNVALLPNVDSVKVPHSKATNDANTKFGQYHHGLANVSNLSSLAQGDNVPGIYHAGGNQQNPNAPLLLDMNVIKVPHSKATNDVNTKVGQYHHGLANVSNSSNLAQGDNVPGIYHAGGNQQSPNVPLFHNMDIVRVPHSKATNDANTKFGQYHHALANVSNSNSLAQGDNMPGIYHAGENELNNLDNQGNSSSKKEQIHDQGNLNVTHENANHMHPTSILPQYEHYSHDPTMSTSDEVRGTLKQAVGTGNIADRFDRENNSNTSPLQLCTPQSGRLQSEINRSSPLTSNIIYSETLNNPIFPEHTVGATLVNQNTDDINLLQEQMEGIKMNVNKTHQCSECHTNIHCGDVVVTVEKIEDAVWHPGCFVCSACNELLADLVYFTHKGKLYCGRDFAELLKIPRCYACDELIFVREYTVAEGHNYHVKHFCCWDCDIPLAEQQYLTENDRPVCLPCYQKNYAQICQACHKVIAADQQGVAIKDFHFHVTEDCFCCFVCKKSLLGGKISMKEKKLICSKECLTKFTHQETFDR